MDTVAVARDYHPFANGKIPEQRRTLGAFCPGYTEAVVSDEEHLQYLENRNKFQLAPWAWRQAWRDGKDALDMASNTSKCGGLERSMLLTRIRAVSRSSRERTRARNAGGRQVLSRIDTTCNETL